MAAEWSYRALGTLTPGFPVPGGGGGSARPGPYAGSMSFLFIIVPILFLVGPLSRPKSHVSFPKRRSQRGVVVLESLSDSGFIAPNMAFNRPYKAQTDI